MTWYIAWTGSRWTEFKLHEDSEDFPIAACPVRAIEVEHGKTNNDPVSVVQYIDSGNLITIYPQYNKTAEQHIKAVLTMWPRHVVDLYHRYPADRGYHRFRMSPKIGPVSYKRPTGQRYRFLGNIVQHRNGEVSLLHKRDANITALLRQVTAG